ncbi:MAG: DUF6174 domain-containing protein [Spirochaetaceae bacterium]|nr:DUF6174 domain-containing protein [Spirochaetaceae bacterium]
MIKKSFAILIILLSIPAALFAFGNKEKNNSPEMKTLLKFEKQWKNSGIKNYTQEIIYSRATFSPEHITITVKNNIVQNWTSSFDNKNLSEDFIKSFTIESIFNRAKETLNSKNDSPFESKISYNQELGYIKSFSFIPANRENITAPLDRGYRIDVISLKTAGKDL